MLYLVNRLQKEKSIDKANKVEAVKYMLYWFYRNYSKLETNVLTVDVQLSDFI